MSRRRPTVALAAVPLTSRAAALLVPLVFGLAAPGHAPNFSDLASPRVPGTIPLVSATPAAAAESPALAWPATGIGDAFADPDRVAALEARIRELEETCPGDPAIVVMPPDASWSITRNASAPTVAASLIKLPLLLSMERLAGRGRLALDQIVDVEASDLTSGSGRLADGRGDRRMPIRELAERMTIESDNTATNALIRIVGKDTLQAEFEAMGLKATRLERRILARGDNPTTAEETAFLLAGLQGSWSRDLLERVENRRRLARHLPAGTRIAHKTGTLRRIVHDAGLIETPAGPMVVVGLVRNARSWAAAEAWLGRLGQAVYEAAHPGRAAIETGDETTRRENPTIRTGRDAVRNARPDRARLER